MASVLTDLMIFLGRFVVFAHTYNKLGGLT
jgi:hypothetical protein